MKKAILRTVYRAGYLVMPVLWRFTRPSVRGAMVAVRLDDRVLFVRNSYRPEWTLPGGGVEPGEEPRDAALRELREEIGWTVGPSALAEIGDVVVWLRHRRDHATIFLHRAPAPQRIEIDGIEVVESRFLTRAEAETRRLQPHVRHFLDALYA